MEMATPMPVPDGAQPIRLTAVGIDRALAEGSTSRPRRRRPDEPSRRLGAEIARLRRRRGLTQERLAEVLGCDRTLVCRWERGERMPTVPRLATLARALERDAGALLRLAAPEPEQGG